jgi:iron(III) transport system substrate-binding protein
MKTKNSLWLRRAVLLAGLFWVPPFLNAAQQIDTKAAQKEGRVTIYSSISIEDITALAQAFEKAYPGIKVEIYRAGKIKLGQRMITEARAGKHRFDVLLSSAFTTLAMKEENLLAKYASPQAAHYEAALTDPHGFWTAAQINPMTIGFNTKLVKKDEVPKRWEDLLDPKWKGKVALNPNRPEWYIALMQLMGREKARKYMQSLAANNTIPTQSATLAREFLGAGEFPIYANAASGNMEEFKQKNAPVDWARLDVLPSYPILASVSAHSDTPNAARLMADFLLSERGQKVFKSMQRIPAHKDIAPEPAYLIKGVKLFHVDINRLKGAEADEMEDEFRKTFNLR